MLVHQRVPYMFKPAWCIIPGIVNNLNMPSDRKSCFWTCWVTHWWSNHLEHLEMGESHVCCWMKTSYLMSNPQIVQDFSSVSSFFLVNSDFFIMVNSPNGSTKCARLHIHRYSPQLRWAASSPWTRAIWAVPSCRRGWRPCSDPSRWWCRTSSSSWRTCSWDARKMD